MNILSIKQLSFIVALNCSLFMSIGCETEDGGSTDKKYDVSFTEVTEQKVGKSTVSFIVESEVESNEGLDVSVTAIMEMASMAMKTGEREHDGHDTSNRHTTYVTDITELGDGEYTTDIYYLMPTMNGTVHMGDWSIIVTVNDEQEDEFDVTVTGAMTDRSMLMGMDGDTIDVDGIESGRMYNLFINPTTSGIEIFAGYRNSMVHHVPLDEGNMMMFYDGASGVVSSPVLSVSLDSGTSWTALTNQGGGIFSDDSINVNSGDTIRMRLAIDGTMKMNGDNMYVEAGIP